MIILDIINMFCCCFKQCVDKIPIFKLDVITLSHGFNEMICKECNDVYICILFVTKLYLFAK